MAKWRLYREDERIIGTNLTILKVLKTGPRQAECRYLARFDCCGHEREISHRAIGQRISGLHKTCMPCGRKASGASRRGKEFKAKEQEFFMPYYHGWEPPASVAAVTPRWL